MSKVFKRVSALVIVFTLIFSFTACAVKSKVNEDAPQASITDEWTFDHATNKGENVPRYLFDKDEDLPHFSSDGTNFTLNIVPGKIYSGTVEKIDDGNYILHKEGSDKSVNVSIAGNSLTVHVSDDTNVVFVVKK